MNQEHKNIQKGHYDEITFRDLILKIREYILELARNWKWILLISIIVSLIMGVRAYTSETEYRARLSFMINQDSGNPLGSISGVLGSFGISAKGKNNLSKVLELARSRKIIEKSLFNIVSVYDKEDLLINHLINYLDSAGQWNQKPWYLPGKEIDSLPLNFNPKTEQLDQHSKLELLALKSLVTKIGGNPDNNTNGFLDTRFNESSRILYLSTTTMNPDLSIQLTNTLFDELSHFYVSKSIEKQQSTYDILKTKTDSLQAVLDVKENQLASFEDTWLGTYSSKSKLQERRLEKEIRLLNLALGESIKNLEIADFAVRNTTPYVQIIDRPIFPLNGYKTSTIRNLILGFIIGFILAGLFFLFKKIYLDAMNY